MDQSYNGATGGLGPSSDQTLWLNRNQALPEAGGVLSPAQVICGNRSKPYRQRSGSMWYRDQVGSHLCLTRMWEGVPPRGKGAAGVKVCRQFGSPRCSIIVKLFSVPQNSGQTLDACRDVGKGPISGPSG